MSQVPSVGYVKAMIYFVRLELPSSFKGVAGDKFVVKANSQGSFSGTPTMLYIAVGIRDSVTRVIKQIAGTFAQVSSGVVDQGKVWIKDYTVEITLSDDIDTVLGENEDIVVYGGRYDAAIVSIDEFKALNIREVISNPIPPISAGQIFSAVASALITVGIIVGAVMYIKRK